MIKENTISSFSKKVSLKRLKRVWFLIFFTSLFGFLFFGLTFLPTFEAVSGDLEKQTFTIFQIAFGTSQLMMNGLFFSSLVTLFIANTLMLVTSILLLRQKAFSPLYALLISFAFLNYVFSFVVFILNPFLAAYTFSVFETFSSLWTIYLMSFLLLLLVLSTLSLLIYLSITNYHLDYLNEERKMYEQLL